MFDQESDGATDGILIVDARVATTVDGGPVNGVALRAQNC